MRKKTRMMGLIIVILSLIYGDVGLSSQASGSDGMSEILSEYGMGYIKDAEDSSYAKEIYSDRDSIIQAYCSDAYYKTPELPAVRTQGQYGVCWASSVISLLEINMMKKGYAEDDFSEMHLAYYTYHTAEDELTGLQGDERIDKDGTFWLKGGGNFTMAVNTLKNWKGAAEEELVPMNAETEKSIAENGLPEEYAFHDIAYLTNYYLVDTTEKEAVKQAVIDYGAIAISFYMDETFSDKTDNYNPQTAAYYCSDWKGVNHGAVIVGWDDAYETSNFSTAPTENGAWIVRNSWGPEYGEEGYFYLSYEDKTVDTMGIAAEAVPASAYHHNYQYDGAVYSKDVFGDSNTSMVKAANLFTVKGNPQGAERLTAVSFVTCGANYEYKVQIYKNMTDRSNPESGEAVIEVKGTTSYVGCYTIQLPETIYLEEGETFSVVVSLTNPYGEAVAISAERNYQGSRYHFTASAKTGQSFQYTNDAGWLDYGDLYHSNIRIKAYTVDTVVKVTAPDNVYNGLAMAEDGNWYYFCDGKSDDTFTGLGFVNNNWWYVSRGKIDFTYSGLVFFRDDWWYVENGCVNFGYNGLAYVNDSWWYVVNGCIDFNYCGLFDYNNEKWYIQGGKIDFGYNNIYYFDGIWWYIENGKVNYLYNGLVYTAFNDKWWYVIEGVISFEYTGSAYANGKNWYVERGEIDFNRFGKVTINGVEKEVAWGEILG